MVARGLDDDTAMTDCGGSIECWGDDTLGQASPP